MAFQPAKVLELELSNPLQDIAGLDRYKRAKVLVRLHGSPLGFVDVPVLQGTCSAMALGNAVVERLLHPVVAHLVGDGLALPPAPSGLRVAELPMLAHPPFQGSLPPVTVAVCTRDRAADLALCLAALTEVDYPGLEILVVDNAPTTSATKDLVATYGSAVRYVCEPRPGLDWARNCAASMATGEIVAYTDDDVIVDRGWVRALGEVFAENPEVMAVTGLVAPYELETEAQQLFEKYGGFGRGFQRKWYARDPRRRTMDAVHLGAGAFGTGANMAFRRALFDEIGLFDPALDVGTVTNGGGDLEMFFRVLKTDHVLVYEPRALVWHRHRREYARLRTQIANNGIGLYSYFVRSAAAYPEERGVIVRFGLWWFWYWNLRRFLKSLVFPRRFPRDLIVAELRGCFTGLRRYQQARRTAALIAGQPSSGAPAPGIEGTAR